MQYESIKKPIYYIKLTAGKNGFVPIDLLFLLLLELVVLLEPKTIKNK